jgi:hypothetical protein
MEKTVKPRVVREPQVIKPVIAPISSDIKVKIADAFQSAVNAIKEKHL